MAGVHRVILHVDMDAFFASVHEREQPELARVPLVVGADPAGGRGVVCTANYRARDFGIRSAMPITEAHRRCPHATFIRPRSGMYRPASQDVMAVLERYADVLQVAGLDEAYLDVTSRCHGDFAVAPSLARSLQAAVKRETQLSCSVGVAGSKSIAKIASDRRKPHGVTVVPPERATVFLDPLPVRLINGCGPKTAGRLEEWGIRTIGDLARMDRAFVEGRFGSHGAWIHAVARGVDERPVVGDHGPRKSRGNERTFRRDEHDPGKVLAAASGLLDGLFADADGRAFSTLSIKLRYSDFTTLTRSHTLSIPLDLAIQGRQLAWACVESLLQPLLDGRPVRLVGVRLSGFGQRTGQRSLGDFAPQVARAFQSTATSGSARS